MVISDFYNEENSKGRNLILLIIPKDKKNASPADLID